MTTFRRSPRNWIGPIAMLAGLSVVACIDFFTEPAPAEPVPIALSLVANANSTGDASAVFDRANRVAVRIERAGTTVADVVLEVAAGGGDLRLRLEVDPDVVGSTLTVHVEVMLGNTVLFAGQGTIVPAAGETATVEVPLEPRVSRIAPPPAPPVLDALGAQLQLEAAAEFATGDTVPDAVLTYRALDPGVVQVSPTGLAVAVAEGTARVEASHGPLSAVFNVIVSQTVMDVEVSPATATILTDATLQLTAKARDPRGNEISGRPVIWSAAPGEHVRVSPTGLVTALEPGTSTVSATADGVTGTAEITVIQRSAPMRPTELTALASGTDVRLTWTYDDTTATRLEVQRRVTTGGSFATIATLAANATSHDDATGRADERFEYRVRACNAVGCSDSDPATVETVPTAPAQLRAQVTNSQTRAFVLEWLDRSRFETGFTIERRKGASEPWESYAEVEAGATSYEGTGEAGTTDRFRVRACNAAGCSAPSNEVELKHADPPPAAPQNLAAKVIGGFTVQLSWTDVATTETRYEVMRRTKPGPDFFTLIEILEPNSTFYEDNTETWDEQFEYLVRACRAGACSESDTITVVTVPFAPTNLDVAHLDPITFEYRLEWEDQSRFEDRFVIERAEYYLAEWQFHAEIGKDVTHFVAVGPGIEFLLFRVRACNEAGCSEPSNEVEAIFVDMLAAVETLPSTSPGMMRGSADGHASLYWVSFEWDYEPELLDINAVDIDQPAIGFGVFEAPLNRVEGGKTVFYRIVASNAVGDAAGEILSLEMPDLNLEVDQPGVPICNQDPAGVGAPQPCPMNARTSIEVSATTTGLAPDYETPFSHVEFWAFHDATNEDLLIGVAPAAEISEVGGWITYRYTIDWTPFYTAYPAGGYMVTGLGVTAAGVRVLAVGAENVSVEID